MMMKLLLLIFAFTNANANDVMKSTQSVLKSNQYQEFISIANDLKNQTHPKNPNSAVNSNTMSNQIPMVFISFSMPESLIKEYIFEAQKYGGILVLRGLVEGSLKKTVLKLKEIEGSTQTKLAKPNLSIIIHPKLFDVYGINQVPALVLSDGGQECIVQSQACKSIYNYDVIFGSITIKHGHEEIAKNGSNSIQQIAEFYLKAYEKQV